MYYLPQNPHRIHHFYTKKEEIRGEPHSQEGIKTELKPLSLKCTFKLWVYNGSFEKKKMEIAFT